MTAVTCYASTSHALSTSAGSSTRRRSPTRPREPRRLGDPTRLTIAVALRESQELCVCDLAWITGRAENLVSHHLRALRAAGLATSRREHKVVFYALTELGMRLLDAHLTPTAAGR
jgi:ArsR family transcriptional regulator, lead/cadmium/zinc/bismuth-responsive transcriptional repressor